MLACFQKQVKQLVNGHGKGWVRIQIKPTTSSKHRLGPLGFTHHVLHVAFVPQVSENEAQVISPSILSLRMKVTECVQAAFDNNRVSVVENKFSSAGIPKWHGLARLTSPYGIDANVINSFISSELKSFQVPLAHSVAVEASSKRRADATARRPPSAHQIESALHCPSCEHARSLRNAKLVGTNGWCTLSCPACKRSKS